jgi:hypothetical protein
MRIVGIDRALLDNGGFPQFLGPMQLGFGRSRETTAMSRCQRESRSRRHGCFGEIAGARTLECIVNVVADVCGKTTELCRLRQIFENGPRGKKMRVTKSCAMTRHDDREHSPHSWRLYANVSWTAMVLLLLQCHNVRAFQLSGGRCRSPRQCAAGPRLHRPTTRLASSLFPSSRRNIQELPSTAVIKAIDSLPSANGVKTVTVADVATAAGVSLSRAKQDCVLLATALPDSSMAVSADGELVFVFPAPVQSALQQASQQYQWRQAWETIVWPRLFYALRVSFGITLVASLVAIFSAIFFINTSSSSSNDDRDDRNSSRSSGGGMSFRSGNMFGSFWGPSPLDFFYYRPYYGYYYETSGQKRHEPPEMGFLESVFSYVFGDGNPNVGLSERQLSLAADYIRSQGGAVIAEQLAPFLAEPPPTQSSSAYVNEGFVLPIVTQLNGEPQVTENGDIVYVFDELQTTTTAAGVATTSFSIQQEVSLLRRAGLATDISTRDLKRVLDFNNIPIPRGTLERSDLLRALAAQNDDDDDPTLLQEEEFKFSVAPELNKVLAGGLGVVNLGGALYLGNILGQYASYGYRLPPFLLAMQGFYPLLLGYAVLFNLIPAIRSQIIQRQNAQIQQRNQWRKQWQAAIASRSLQRKLQSARDYQTKMKQIDTAKDIVYDTATGSAESLAQERQERDLAQFDEMLQKQDTPPQLSVMELNQSGLGIETVSIDDTDNPFS